MPSVDLRAALAADSAERAVVLSVGKVERNRRIPAAAALGALGWGRGMVLRAHACGRRIVILAAHGGAATATVTTRAQIAVPIAVRRLARIDSGATVVLAAIVERQIMVVHLATDVVRLLRRRRARATAGRPRCASSPLSERRCPASSAICRGHW